VGKYFFNPIKIIKMGKNQHVTRNPSGGWNVIGEGNSKPTVIKETQKEAINTAITIAKNQQSEVVIHGVDGKIRDKDSYGNDPMPPIDKKK
jgi:hypothetical protein